MKNICNWTEQLKHQNHVIKQVKNIEGNKEPIRGWFRDVVNWNICMNSKNEIQIPTKIIMACLKGVTELLDYPFWGSKK